MSRYVRQIAIKDPQEAQPLDAVLKGVGGMIFDTGIWATCIPPATRI